MSIPRLGRLYPKKTALFVCDIQERFRPLIHSMSSIIHVANSMVKSCNDLDIPIIATEQYPKALGKSVGEIDLTKAQIFEKKNFSMLVPEVRDALRKISPSSVLLIGIEAHVCVLQTALDLAEEGIDVHVIADGVSSQRRSDRMLAFERMRQSGIFVTSSESAIFQLMGSADFPAFKAVQAHFKGEKPDDGL